MNLYLTLSSLSSPKWWSRRLIRGLLGLRWEWWVGGEHYRAATQGGHYGLLQFPALVVALEGARGLLLRR